MVCMYVRTMASCLFLLHLLSLLAALTVWKREAGLEAGRVGQGLQQEVSNRSGSLARDFRLGLAGGGWDDCKLELSSSTGQSNLNLLTHW